MNSFVRSGILMRAYLASLIIASTGSVAFAFEDRDCGSVQTVQQTYSTDLKSSDNIDVARTRATQQLVRNAIGQVVGYELHSDREQNTQILNDAAQEKYQDAEQSRLDGLARVRIVDEKRTALPDGQTLTLTAEVKVCVPKPEAVIKAERDRAERLRHPPKRVDPATAVWFNPASGQPQIWFSKKDDGTYSFFDNAGFDPETGEALKPISSKVLKEWRSGVARKRREQVAQAEAEKAAAQQKAIDDEKARDLAEKHAELVAHARENCDKLAANPNDPDKPRSIAGSSFDDLKASSDQAVEACDAAVQIDPTDRRLRYQFARAISVDDPKKAMPMFKALCGERYRAAFDNYGWALVDRRVGQNNLPAALAFFRKGAELGDSDAMVSLASYIQRGRVPGSPQVEAIRLYRQAVALGNDDASKALVPLLAAQQQAEQQQQQDMRNAQAVMGLFGTMMGGVRR